MGNLLVCLAHGLFWPTRIKAQAQVDCTFSLFWVSDFFLKFQSSPCFLLFSHNSPFYLFFKEKHGLLWVQILVKFLLNSCEPSWDNQSTLGRLQWLQIHTLKLIMHRFHPVGKNSSSSLHRYVAICISAFASAEELEFLNLALNCLLVVAHLISQLPKLSFKSDLQLHEPTQDTFCCHCISSQNGSHIQN